MFLEWFQPTKSHMRVGSKLQNAVDEDTEELFLMKVSHAEPDFDCATVEVSERQKTLLRKNLSP